MEIVTARGFVPSFLSPVKRTHSQLAASDLRRNGSLIKIAKSSEKERILKQI